MNEGGGRTGDVGIVVITMNRSAELAATLDALLALPERPPIVVVDNGSSDDTLARVRNEFPSVMLVALPENCGPAARNIGVDELDCPYVAFCDDDMPWEPGSLAAGATLFGQYPRLAVISARVLVGPNREEDPINQTLAATALRADHPVPGTPILGFLAGATIVRRRAFRAVGGFVGEFGIGGEEELLAYDLSARGWDLCYVPDLVVHHMPSPVRDHSSRRRRLVRNRLLVAWMRRPTTTALRLTAQTVRAARTDAECRGAVVDALRRLPWALRARRTLPRQVEERIRTVEAATAG